MTTENRANIFPNYIPDKADIQNNCVISLLRDHTICRNCEYKPLPPLLHAQM